MAVKVLLTGATGYIGGLLRKKLLRDDHTQLRLFVRDKQKIKERREEHEEIHEGSTFDTESLRNALRGVDAAYYLIHSMNTKADYRDLDRISAENFLEACIETKVKRIIYLGGLGEKQTASKHLLSRIETGEILSSRPESIQTIWLRAGIIIGAGSASFDIIRSIVYKLPLMITPRWVHTKTQPIAVDDVLEYLLLSKSLTLPTNLVVDIGSEEMSFKDMIIRASKVMGKKRVLIPVPLLSPKLSSYWLIFITHVPFRIAKALIDGLKSETILQNDNARIHFPQISPMTYEEAVRSALPP